MHSITWLKNKLAADFSDLHFAQSDDFSWNPNTKTVSFAPHTPHAQQLLLHETAHALLGHAGYRRDIELLRIERAAWEHAATTLAPQYDISVPQDLIEHSLDTYRDWLHKRSSCPSCKLNGLQDSPTTYHCIHCHERWSVNEARTCRLKRTRL